MNPNQLRYHTKKALRYSDPPPYSALNRQLETAASNYTKLLSLHTRARQYYEELLVDGIFQSIPTLTSETKNSRPGTYWRAIFKTNSPEVLHGLPRKHYIGSNEAKLDEWNEWITRTHLAMQVNSLIHDIGQRLKTHYATLKRTADIGIAAVLKYTLTLEELTQ